LSGASDKRETVPVSFYPFFFLPEVFLAAGFLAAPFFAPPGFAADFFVGRGLRLVLATSLSCFSLIDFSMLLEGPLSELFGFFPRLAVNAAPAAICCFLDFAGMGK
jgi:hypothetical protein